MAMSEKPTIRRQSEQERLGTPTVYFTPEKTSDAVPVTVRTPGELPESKDDRYDRISVGEPTPQKEGYNLDTIEVESSGQTRRIYRHPNFEYIPNNTPQKKEAHMQAYMEEE